MQGRGAIGADDKRAYDAVTKWRIAWKWDGDGKGGCRLDAARVDLKSVVRLPLLDRMGVPGDTLADWDRYDAALRAHEAGHVRIARAHLADVEAAIRGATCATANAAGQAALDRIREANRAYDRETRHGVRTGAVFPPP